MKVAIELFKGKKLIDGTFPIAIRATHLGKNKYKMIGISSFEKHWNKDKKRITCRAELFREKNEIIQREYNNILNRANWFIDNNIAPDLDFIFSNKSLDSYHVTTDFNVEYDTNNFIDIIRARIDSYSKIKTKENYKAFLNVMIKMYGDYISLNKINQAFAIQFRNQLDLANYSSNHKNSLIKCFTSSYKFGAENRWISNPFIITIKKYPHQPLDRDISHNDLTKIIGDFKKLLECGSNFENYKPLAIFILDLALHGLAPIDLAKIQIKDLNLEEINAIDVNNELLLNDDNYKEYINNTQVKRKVITINTYRSKTGKLVPICVDYSSIRPLLYFFCKNKTKEDYLIDCFNINKTYTEKQMHNKCGKFYYDNTIKLNEYLKGWNLSQKVTYYIARHAFINALNEMRVPHHLIRKMVGHKDNALEKSYINKPTKWEQSKITYDLFNGVQTIEELEIQGKGYTLCEKQWGELEMFLVGQIDRF